jgi:hypothetical protein
MLTRWAAWPRGLRWLTGGIAAVVLALAIAWVLFVPAADWLAHNDVGSVKGPLLQTARDAARGRLLTLGAGLFAAGALIFTARNFTLSRRTFELTEQGQVTERYTKAIEQLGSDKLDVRIGGVYALERIARDSATDHPTVMEVLSAFVRVHSRERWPPATGKPETTKAPAAFTLRHPHKLWPLATGKPRAGAPGHRTRPDVQAAVTVIGRRDTRRDQERINLLGANLTRAYLPGAQFTQANLIRANLTNAFLSGASLTEASLQAAKLTGAQLRRAYLPGAKLDYADLTDADFTDADLTDARWPPDAAVPEGWERDTGSGRLRRTHTDSDEDN